MQLDVITNTVVATTGLLQRKGSTECMQTSKWAQKYVTKDVFSRKMDGKKAMLKSISV